MEKKTDFSVSQETKANLMVFSSICQKELSKEMIYKKCSLILLSKKNVSPLGCLFGISTKEMRKTCLNGIITS
jgi:hypothetical protein